MMRICENKKKNPFTKAFAFFTIYSVHKNVSHKNDEKHYTHPFTITAIRKKRGKNLQRKMCYYAATNFEWDFNFPCNKYVPNSLLLQNRN